MNINKIDCPNVTASLNKKQNALNMPLNLHRRPFDPCYCN